MLHENGPDAATWSTHHSLDQDTSPPKYNFAFADFLKREYRFGIPLSRPLCKADAEGHCPLGNVCPDRHRFSRSRDICKHWLKGLCKKGDHCEFLHEYNLRRMPECVQYARTLTCPNGDDCLYQHTDPTSRLPPCPHYEQGFCPLGPRCAKKHVEKSLCKFYLAGFCPYGRQCKFGAHPRWTENLPKPTVKTERTEAELEAERERLREEAEREDDRDWERSRGGRDGRNRGKGRYGQRRRY